MQILYPEYYDNFHCLAGKCPDSCCKDWCVQIDEDSAKTYRALPGALGDALRANLQVEDGETILALSQDGRCPMWRDDNLCRIHAELGESYLCHTCREFPRLRHDYGDFLELGLELSCPEAARLILSGFCQYISITAPEKISPEYNHRTMSILLRSRTTALEIISNPSLSIGEALAVLLLYAYTVQEELDGNDFVKFSSTSALNACKQLAQSAEYTHLLSLFKDLEILTPDWQQLLNNPSPSTWQKEHRAMAQYFIMRYWLQSVSDLDLIGRTKFCIVSCLITKLLGGSILRTAQLYSKEVENNLDNVYTILNNAYTSPALTDVNLLGLLLEIQ